MAKAGETTRTKEEHLAKDLDMKERERLPTEGANVYLEGATPSNGTGTAVSHVKKNIDKGMALQRRHSGPEAIETRSASTEGMECDDDRNTDEPMSTASRESSATPT